MKISCILRALVAGWLIGTVAAQGAFKVQIDGSPTLYNSISDALAAAVPNDTVIVGDGVFAENVLISIQGITLRSQNGRGSTTIAGISGAGALGTITVAPGVNDVSIEGLTIIGIDNDLPGIENAAVYFPVATI